VQVQLLDEDGEAEEVPCKTSMVKINENWGHHFQGMEEYLQEISMVEGRNDEGGTDSQDSCSGWSIEERKSFKELQ
jgi:hypothetical protein